MSIPAEYLPAIEAAARSNVYLKDYIEFVYEWRVRPHQAPWVEAIQALVQEPPCWETHGTDECFACRVHDERRLLIVAFPGSGKTDTACEFASWCVGKLRDKAAFGFFSYNDNIATERSMAVRDVVWNQTPVDMNERFNLCFPGIKPAPARPWSQERWFIQRADVGNKNPTMVAAGMDGSVNARRLIGLALDDPHNLDNSRSTYQRSQVKRSYNLTARTRLLADGWKLCISGRWAEDDLPGYFIDQGWPTIRTPALDDNDESTWPYEGQNLGYRTEDLRRLREEDPQTFMLQYQGMVVPEEGDETLKKPASYGEWQRPQSFQKVIQIWDTAEKKGNDRSETVCVTLGKAANGKCYMLDPFFAGQPGASELPYLLDAQAQRCEEELGQLDAILVEDKSSGSGLLDYARRYSSYRHLLRPVTVGGRGHTKQSLFQDRVRTPEGEVHSVALLFGEVLLLPLESPWRAKALAQIAVWPFGKRNDIVMALVHGLRFLYRQAGPVPQIQFIERF